MKPLQGQRSGFYSHCAMTKAFLQSGKDSPHVGEKRQNTFQQQPPMCVTICDSARPPPPIPPFLLAVFKTDCATLIASWMMSALVIGSQRLTNTPPQ